MSNVRSDKPFILAGRTYQSRLLVGTGKYRDMEETRLAIEASGAEIVTVAVRRTNIGQNPGEPNLLDILPPDRYTILPNTAGCYDAVEAVRTCRLARELLDGQACLFKVTVLASADQQARLISTACEGKRLVVANIAHRESSSIVCTVGQV